MAKLVVQIDKERKTFDMVDGKPLFAGRTGECDLYLPAPGVSRRHAVFLARKGECGIKDLDSSNGTFLNGRRLTRSVRLRDGDIIQIANFVIVFQNDVPVIQDGSRRSSRRLSRNTLRRIRETAEYTAVGGAAVAEARKSPPERRQLPETDAADPVTDVGAGAGTEAPSAADAQAAVSSIATLPGQNAENHEIDPACDLDGSTESYEPESEPPPEGASAPGEMDVDSVGTAGVPDDNGYVSVQATDIIPTTVQPGDYEPDPNAIPIDAGFRQAIETRLCLYSFLYDLKAEREELLLRRPDMPDAVKNELARQDREIDKIPNAEQAEGMIEKRQAKQAALMERVQEARKKGEPPPPLPPPEMQEAEDIAISQWTLCSQSFREALPAVYAEGFKLAEDEPLTEHLIKAEVNPVPFLGGACYYLALEVLAGETKAARQAARDKLAGMDDPSEKKSGGVFGMFSRSKQQEEPEEPEPGESFEELTAAESQLADRMGWINQEIAYMEKTLIQEFWRIYSIIALRFLPEHETMPAPVRAFLRHGAIGFKQWWMKDEVRDHIVMDVRDDVVHHMEVSRGNTNILYADEYLAAVMNNECTPALDENLEINERNSPNWKADKAIRRLINARSQRTLLDELIGNLNEKIQKLEEEAAKVEEKISKLVPGMKNFKPLKNELSQTRQTLRVEVSKLGKLIDKIQNETMANLTEIIDDTEQRFDSGELPRPTREFLISRECEAVHKIGRLLANLKERFMPLVLRDNFQVDTDAVNDRPSITGEILEMERRDPAMFIETLVPSKKKANRVELRISPVIVLLPSAGVLAFSWNPRGKPEDGRLAIPTCFIRRRIRERQLTYLIADFRWDTSKAAAGMDVMTSDTIVAAFMTVRWDWRKKSKEGREKGLIFTEQNDRTNWRRVYEAYMQTAYDSGKKLFNRNYDFYERIIGKYFDLPEGVPLLKK